MTRDLQCLQTFILELDIGLWSGFKRKIEMAESFLLPPLTVRNTSEYTLGINAYSNRCYDAREHFLPAQIRLDQYLWHRILLKSWKQSGEAL